VRKIIVFGIVLMLGFASLFVFSACPSEEYRQVAGTYHGLSSGGRTYVLTLNANGNSTIQRLRSGMMIDTEFETITGTFSVIENNRLTFIFDGQRRDARLTGGGNIELNIRAVEVWIRQQS